MLAALTILGIGFQLATVNIYRGAQIASPRYWDVRETYLDQSKPDMASGSSYTIEGGPGKPMLIRFGDLNRVVGPNKRVVSAKLFFTPAGVGAVSLKSAGRLLEDWGAGPMETISHVFKPPIEGSPDSKPKAPRWAATFKQRHAGFSNWQAPGAAGAQDVKVVAGATLESGNGEISINGLEEAVQQMLDHPSENYGFELNFTTDTEFYSSQSQVGRPRLAIVTEDLTPQNGPNLSVTLIGREAEVRSGQEATYVAHIKNVGDQEAKPFKATWLLEGKEESPTQGGPSLAPGAETTLTFKHKWENDPLDHRTHPIAIRIEPGEAELCSTNKELSIDENAVPVIVNVDADAAKRLTTSTNFLGSKGMEDWIQAQVRLWNDTYAAQSRFSFAPEGALERLRVSSIVVGSTGNGAQVTAQADPLTADVAFQRQLSLAAGLLDGKEMSIRTSQVQVPGSSTREQADLYPGLMGYGDTRWDGGVPGALPLDYVPVYNGAMDSLFLEPTDLLCATDVAALNDYLGRKETKPSDALLPIRPAVVLHVQDLNGRPITGTELNFYQSVKGGFVGGQPTFTVRTNDSGIAVLGPRGTAGPFGDLTPDAGNATFLVQAKSNGATDTAWLKAWQLSDATRRGSLTSDLRLNLPELPLLPTNLALDKTITDSTSDLPAKLAALNDDDEETETSLPDGKDSWVEIDLGRDRSIGELDLVTKGAPFWQRFDVLVYATGQKPSEAETWTREVDWAWTSANRRDAGKTPRAAVVTYRAAVRRIRYLRIINKSGGPGSLAEIRVFPAKIGQ